MSAAQGASGAATVEAAVLWFCMRGNILLPAAAALLAASALASAAETSWRDIESRIQYGYYTEDGAALRNLRGLIAADESHDRLHGYYSALLAWRESQLAALGVASSRGVSAAELAKRCVSEADNVLAAQADFAAARALRAACLGSPLNAGNSVISGRGARQEIERALKSSPHDPRALLVDGMNEYQLSGGNKDRALGKLRRAVAAFEGERAGLEQLPGWGAAEAYLYLARNLLDHADAVAARDALEHALLIAPEFAQARRLMAHILGG